MHSYLALDPPHLFAHRGASGEAPENTLVAFERPWAAGVPYLETDCRATSDGEIVLQHDSRVDRTTDGEGPVSAYTYRELQRLDAGYRFTLDAGVTAPFRGRGVRIARLAELIEAFPEARINLEVKQARPEIIDEVVRVIHGAGAEHRVLLAAEQDSIMKTIRNAAPETAIGMSRSSVTGFFQALREGRIADFQPLGHALQIPPKAFGEDLVTPDSIEAAHSLGLCVHVWTINDADEMWRLLKLGVDGLMSDYPSRLVRVASG